VKDLNSEQIRFLVQKDERYLKDIFKGKVITTSVFRFSKSWMEV